MDIGGGGCGDSSDYFLGALLVLKKSLFVTSVPAALRAIEAADAACGGFAEPQ